MVKILPQNNNSLAIAKQIIQSGGLVAVPTETVYGLAADATNPEAINKLFNLKNRPKDRAISVLLPNLDLLEKWAVDIPEIAYRLGEQFWPGPLTLIFKKAPRVSSLLTAGKETIGLRIPDHAFTLKLLAELSTGLAAPSANLSGEKSPTTAEEVARTLGDQIDLIIDGGKCKVGIASTIVDLTQSPFKILREGSIKQNELETRC